MLLQSQLQSFFEEHDIPLQGTLKIGKWKINEVFLKALANEHSLACFLLTSTFNGDRDGYETHFISYDSLYEAYCCYMTGKLGYSC